MKTPARRSVERWAQRWVKAGLVERVTGPTGPKSKETNFYRLFPHQIKNQTNNACVYVREGANIVSIELKSPENVVGDSDLIKRQSSDTEGGVSLEPSPSHSLTEHPSEPPSGSCDTPGETILDPNACRLMNLSDTKGSQSSSDKGQVLYGTTRARTREGSPLDEPGEREYNPPADAGETFLNSILSAWNLQEEDQE